MLIILNIVINLVIFLLIIGILTFIHELGHFIAAKSIGAKVFEFALGFGPRIVSKKIGETEYSLRALPFGGYVKILGDGDPSKEEFKKGDERKDLSKKPKWQQLIVMLAGVTMNILLAIVIYYIVIGTNGWKLLLSGEFENFKPLGATISREIDSEVKYSKLIDGGSAKEAGLPEQGVIKAIDGVEVKYTDEIGRNVRERKEQLVVINVCADNDCKDYTVRVSDKGMIGVSLPPNYTVVLSYEKNKLFTGFSHVYNSLSLIGMKLKSMISLARSTGDYQELSNSVSGPIGMYLIIDYFKQFGFVTLLGIVADLSISLAIFNILPVPALDGGRAFILLIEWIVGKELDEKLEAAIINVSFILLIILILFIMVKDIVNIDSIKSMFN